MDSVIYRAMESTSKGKMDRKVTPSALALIARPQFEMSADLAEGLIVGACWHKGLLAKQFANNWNQGYHQVINLAEGG